MAIVFYNKNLSPLNSKGAFIQGVPLATEPGIADIATKFEQEYVRCVRNEEECVCSVCL
jgi:hypothetical protein